VVIHEFDFISVTIAPCEAEAPLVIDANAVLTLSITLRGLQSISRQGRERANVGSGVEHIQFPKGLAFDGLKPANGFPLEEAPGVGATEGPYHCFRVYCCPVNVKQYSEDSANIMR
jgi:hypothetical protein